MCIILATERNAKKNIETVFLGEIFPKGNDLCNKLWYLWHIVPTTLLLILLLAYIFQWLYLYFYNNCSQ